MNKLIRIAVASLAIGGFSSAAQAGHSASSLVREAHRVEDLADQLKREVRLHFRHTSEYGHLLSDAAKVRNEAAHIDSLAHHVHSLADVRHIAKDLEDLDELVHHIGDLIEDIEHGHGRGHTHGDTRHVRSLVACINRSLHTMQRVVRDLEYEFGRDRDRCRTDSHRGRGPSVGERIAGEVLREVLRHHRR